MAAALPAMSMVFKNRRLENGFSLRMEFSPYRTSIFIRTVEAFNLKEASSNPGGPKVPRALFENPYRSTGIPNILVSSSWLLFSSW
jgi:hypothetical protein